MAFSSFFSPIISFRNWSADSFLILMVTGFCSSTFLAYSLSFLCVDLENNPCIFSYSTGLTRKEIQEGILCSLITIHFHIISGKRQALFFAALPFQQSFAIVPPTPEAQGPRCNCATIEHLAGCRHSNL